METLFLPVVIILAITLPLVAIYKLGNKKSLAKKLLFVNLGLFLTVSLVTLATPLFAETTANAAGKSVGDGLAFLAAALAVGMSGIGGGSAVASAASAAIGATGENPDNFVRSLTFVALAEGVALYGFVIAIQIIGKL